MIHNITTYKFTHNDAVKVAQMLVAGYKNKYTVSHYCKNLRYQFDIWHCGRPADRFASIDIETAVFIIIPTLLGLYNVMYNTSDIEVYIKTLYDIHLEQNEKNKDKPLIICPVNEARQSE